VIETTDQQLLRQFAESRADGPFEEVIRRHVDLVYSAAKRLVVDPHLAEDVSQAVFAALAQEPLEVARKLESGAPLSGWLHLTTRNIAAKTVRAEMRRRAREEKAIAMHDRSPADHDPEWNQLAPQLDHALSELSEKDRDALLLRFFEHKTAREIGQCLGVSEEAAQKRVRRALEDLRAIFVRRGLTLPSATLGACLTANSVQASPLALADAIAKGILFSGKALASGGVSSTAFSKLLPSLLMTKTQTAILTGVIAVMVIPMGRQRALLNRLQAETSTHLRPTPPDVTTDVDRGKSAVNSSRDEEEITKLRTRAEDLRAAIAARKSLLSGSSSLSTAQMSAVLISDGRPELLKNLAFAGNSTPEAALQSVLALKRDGDIDRLSRLLLLPPKDVEEWNRTLSSPAERKELIQGLVEEMQGAVLSSGWDGQEAHESKSWPKDRQADAVVSVQEKSVIDERRVQFQVKIAHGAQSRIDSCEFGLTAGGWKEIGN
jgi:RNA polymerase sigma factor (sigma-70 family)